MQHSCTILTITVDTMKKAKKLGASQNGGATLPQTIVAGSKSIIESVTETTKDIKELIPQEWREKVMHMIKSFPNLPNTIEEMLQYYSLTLEYFDLYTLDPFDPKLDRVEQKLDLLSGKLGLHYEVSKNVKLKARQLLAYS
jgi:hypothetical protein